MMETIFQIGLIVIDALLIATTESKAVKIMGVIAILFLAISLIGKSML